MAPAYRPDRAFPGRWAMMGAHAPSHPAAAADGPGRVPLARRRFLAGERLDMTALATELGVNRVTLYRWVGSREKLLVEVIWDLGTRTLRDAHAPLAQARRRPHRRRSSRASPRRCWPTPA